MNRGSPARRAARRALALAGLALLAAGLATFADAARPAAAAGAAGAVVRNSSVTIRGARLYNGSSGLLRQRSSVTVSQTGDLVNQTVQVSWSHFTPSQNAPYTSNTLYAVIIAECRNTHPVS